jgi:hypothetical protein
MKQIFSILFLTIIASFSSLRHAFPKEYRFDATHVYKTVSVSSRYSFDNRVLMQETAHATVKSSTNPDFDGSFVVDQLQYDSINNKGNHVAYAIETHKDGDETHWKFVGDHDVDANMNGNSKGIGYGMGGTGKYAKFSGRVNYTCHGGAENTTCRLIGKVNY